MSFTNSDIMSLHAQTGVGVMKCKEFLQISEGDIRDNSQSINGRASTVLQPILCCPTEISLRSDSQHFTQDEIYD